MVVLWFVSPLSANTLEKLKGVQSELRWCHCHGFNCSLLIYTVVLLTRNFYMTVHLNQASIGFTMCTT